MTYFRSTRPLWPKQYTYLYLSLLFHSTTTLDRAGMPCRSIPRTSLTTPVLPETKNKESNTRGKTLELKNYFQFSDVCTHYTCTLQYCTGRYNVVKWTNAVGILFRTQRDLHLIHTIEKNRKKAYLHLHLDRHSASRLPSQQLHL